MALLVRLEDYILSLGCARLATTYSPDLHTAFGVDRTGASVRLPALQLLHGPCFALAWTAAVSFAADATPLWVLSPGRWRRPAPTAGPVGLVQAREARDWPLHGRAAYTVRARVDHFLWMPVTLCGILHSCTHVCHVELVTLSCFLPATRTRPSGRATSTKPGRTPNPARM